MAGMGDGCRSVFPAGRLTVDQLVLKGIIVVDFILLLFFMLLLKWQGFPVGSVPLCPHLLAGSVSVVVA